MTVSIKAIHIVNFRSIGLLDARISPLTVFVGKNDCGKSNILRALNLFFNGRTNHGVEFNFEDDYNFFAPERKRKAKEIVVRIEIEIPKSYQRTNGDRIIWEKRWRKEGLVGGDDNYHGVRLAQNKRGKETRRTVKIPDKSNIHALLRKIEFEYVPAVKDALYFDGLRGRIYSIISEVASRTFRTSSTAFEKSIGEHLDDLTKSIDKSIGDATRLALPRDLSHIFEKLDFLSGKQSVSLENRGDGIKARHIPLILIFMALKKVSLQVRGGMPSSFIWGYEEPENSLEFSSAIALSDELIDHVKNDVAQILLTTHSPAFYDLAQKSEDIFLQHVSRQTDVDGTKANGSNSDLDESMGTLAMIAPRVSEIVAEVRDQEKAKSEAQRLIEQKRPKIFVEGESDELILKRAMALFSPGYVGKIDFQTKRGGGGHSYVLDMLMGWRSQHKHHTKRPKAAGIVDGDAAKCKNDFNKSPDNIKSAKCFCYPTPDHIFGAFQKGFSLHVDLELLYPAGVWEWAKKNSHLELRPPQDVFPNKHINLVVSGKAKLDEILHDDWRIYVEHKFKDSSKITTAKYLVRKKDEECLTQLRCFKPLIDDLLEYLGLID